MRCAGADHPPASSRARIVFSTRANARAKVILRVLAGQLGVGRSVMCSPSQTLQALCGFKSMAASARQPPPKAATMSWAARRGIARWEALPFLGKHLRDARIV